MDRVGEFQPEAVIRLLGRHGVRYVLIGGLAAVTHGAPLVTQDVDVCYAREDANLDRLATALTEVHAHLRGADPDLPFKPEAKTLRAGDAFTLATDIGWLDILGSPAGTSGCEDLARTADVFTLFGYEVMVASIEDLIRMKRAAGRPKDLLAVEELAALREELAGQAITRRANDWPRGLGALPSDGQADEPRDDKRDVQEARNLLDHDPRSGVGQHRHDVG